MTEESQLGKEKAQVIGLSLAGKEPFNGRLRTYINIDTNLHTARVHSYGLEITESLSDLYPFEKPFITLEIEWESRLVRISYAEHSQP